MIIDMSKKYIVNGAALSLMLKEMEEDIREKIEKGIKEASE